MSTPPRQPRHNRAPDRPQSISVPTQYRYPEAREFVLRQQRRAAQRRNIRDAIDTLITNVDRLDG